MKFDPYEILKVENEENWPEGYNARQEAIKHFSFETKDQLLELLKSENPIFRGRAYPIFSMIGDKSFMILDEAIRYHKYEFEKFDILDAMMGYIDKLNEKQMSFVKACLKYPDDLIQKRAKLILKYR